MRRLPCLERFFTAGRHASHQEISNLMGTFVTQYVPITSVHEILWLGARAMGVLMRDIVWCTKHDGSHVRRGLTTASVP